MSKAMITDIHNIIEAALAPLLEEVASSQKALEEIKRAAREQVHRNNSIGIQGSVQRSTCTSLPRLGSGYANLTRAEREAELTLYGINPRDVSDMAALENVAAIAQSPVHPSSGDAIEVLGSRNWSQPERSKFDFDAPSDSILIDSRL